MYVKPREDEVLVKKIYFLIGILILGITAMVFFHSKNPKAQESITFFPIDPKVTFITTETSLELVNHNSLLWKMDSTLDRKAYLRQDVGFLFSNGRLIGQLGNWKQNKAAIIQEKRVSSDKSAFLQAISFHYAELHKNEGQIYSSQALSADQLYIVLQDENTAYSFRDPKTREQNKSKQELDEQTERKLQYSWNKGVRYYGIHLRDYQAFPLNQFNKRAKSGLPGFTKQETDTIVGQLWEGLYKNYFLGIKGPNGTIANPIGSTLPLILLANNKSHLLVLTETVRGEPIFLRQMIEDID